jgi:hypothetical protein
MRRIKWFQRTMIIALVNLNLLFYAVSEKLNTILVITFVLLMLISMGLMLSYFAQRNRKSQSIVSERMQEEV